MEVLKSRRPLTVVLLTLTLLASPTLSAEPNAIEYEVKAAFLFNFLKFVDWPAAPDGPWVIGVVGASNFAGILEGTVRGKTVKGFPVTVKRLPAISAARSCHIVFVPMPVQGPLTPLPGVLTVGDDLHFLDAGGIVSFYLEDSKVRFEIQADAAKAAGLRVSAQLLKLGKIR
jgi:hypothetical protein